MGAAQPKRIAASRPIKAEFIRLEGETAHLVRFLATRGDSESKSEDVFPSKRTGKPLNVKRVAKRFRRILKRASLGPFKLYDLRHSYASRLLDQRIKPVDVAEVMDTRV